MKKILLLFFLVAGIQHIYSQTMADINESKRIESLKRLLSQTAQPIERYKLLSAISNRYYMTGIGENSADNNLEMLRIALHLKDDSLIAVSYNKAGDYFLFEKSDFNTSIDYFFKGIPYAEKSNNKRTISSLYIDLSLAYYWALNPHEEFKNLKKAEANFPDTSHPDYKYMLLQLKLNYGLYYLSIEKPDSAMLLLNEAVEVNRKLKFPAFDFFLKSMFGNLFEQIGDKELATVYFQKALAIDSMTVYPFAKVTFRNFYIRFLINSGNYTEAIKQAGELMDIGETSQNNVTRFFAAGFLKTVYDKVQKIDSAYHYSKQESALREIIYNQEKLNKVQALAFNEEIRLAEEQNRILKEQDQRKQNIQYALIAIGIIVLLSVFLLLSRSFITNTKMIEFLGVIALLIVFEFLNLLLHPFLENITHHSPVLMLLALVFIAALLVPLHHTLEKRAIAKLVEKNKLLRLAAAKKTIKQLETSEHN